MQYCTEIQVEATTQFPVVELLPALFIDLARFGLLCRRQTKEGGSDIHLFSFAILIGTKFQSSLEFLRLFLMAWRTKSPEVIQIARSTTFRNRNDMICLPKVSFLWVLKEPFKGDPSSW